MKRLSNIFVVLFAIAAMTSCYQDDIVLKPSYGSQSDVISFSANLSFTEDEISRSESVERIGRHLLCSEQDDITLPMGIYQQNGIESLYSDATRGSKFTKEQLNSMRVWGTLTPTSGGAFTYINGDTYTKQTNEEFTTTEVYLWPGSGTLKFDVFANLPDVTINESNGAATSFTYTVPTTVTEQKDIVYASASVSGDYGQAVPLTFEHIMAAVNFKVGTIAHGTIKSITLKGVYNTGIYNFSNGQWAILNQDESHKSDYNVPLAGGQFNVDGNIASDTFINDQNSGTLFMIPQIVGEGATVEVVFAAPGANDRVLTASIAGDDWGKDIVTNYTISIDEQYNLNITPVGKLLDAHYIIAQVEVTVEGMNDGDNVSNPNKWTLTANVGGNTNNSKVTMLTANRIAAEESDATKHSNELSMVEAGFWCDEYVNRNTVDGKYVYTSTGESARGATQITGTGNCSKQLIYILIPENNSTVNRTIELTLQKVNDSKVSKAVTLTQRCPGWTDDGKYGWETVDDDEDGQYGFTYTRKAHYIFAYSFTWSVLFGYRHIGFGSIDDAISDVQTKYVDIYAPNIAGFTSFTTIDWATAQRRFYMTIDYRVLNNLNIKEKDDGLKNTVDLYTQGGSAVTTFEQIIANAPKTYRNETGPTFRERDPANDPAAFPASEGSINDLSGILTYVLKKNRYYLHSYNNGTADINAPILMSTDDIKWYIPAYGQFSTFVPNPNITDKDGGTDSADDYWSSTASDNATNPADALSYHGGGSAISRATELGVIAVRNKDGDTYEAPATVTVDNSSIAGGENGDTNQWVE